MAGGIEQVVAPAVGVFADLATGGSNKGTAETSTPRQFQDALNEVRRSVDESRSEQYKNAERAEWVDTGQGNPSAWDTPVRTMRAQIVRMAPMLVGLALLPEGGVGVLAGSLIGGGQAAAQHLNDRRAEVMEMPDADLQKKSSVYHALRLQGIEESAAREQLVEKQDNAMATLLAGAGGAASGGLLGHALKGQRGTGVLKGVGIGAADASTGMATMGAAGETAKQMSEIEGGQRQSLTPEDILLGAANAAVTGALMGGPLGALGGRGKRRSEASAAAEPKEAAKPLTADEVTAAVPLAEKAAMETANGDQSATPTAEKVLQDVEQFRQQTEQEMAPPPPVEGPLDAALRQRAEQDALAPKEPVVAPEPPPIELPNLPRTPDAPVMVPEALNTRPPPLTAEEIAARVPAKTPEPAPAPVVEPPAAAPRQMVDMDAEAAKSLDKLLAEPPAVEPPPPPVPKKGTLALKTKEAPVTPEGNSEPRKPRVLKATVETMAERAARLAVEAERAKANAKLAENAKQEVGAVSRGANAERMQKARLEKAKSNEGRAKRIFDESAPKGDDLKFQDEIEAAVMKDGPKAKAALDRLDEQARIAVEAAEADGVVIQRQTTSLAAPGDKNLTPHVNRLRSMKRFRELYAKYKTMENAPAKVRARMAERMKRIASDYVQEGKLLREGKDSSGPRVERNEEITRKHREAGAKGSDELEKLAAKDDGVDEQFDVPRGWDRVESDGRPKAQEDTSSRETTAAEMLGEVRKDLLKVKAPGFAFSTHPSGTLLARVIDKLIAKVGDTPVHFMSRAKFAEGMPQMPNAGGVFISNRHGITSEGKRGIVAIPNDMKGHREFPRVAIHEVVHAATTHALNASKDFRDSILKLHKVVMDHLDFEERVGNMTRQQAADWRGEYGLQMKDGLANPAEFVAEALANPRLQKLLMQVEAPRNLRFKFKNMWQSLIHQIADLFGLNRVEENVLEATLNITEAAMDYKPQRSPDVTIEGLRKYKGAMFDPSPIDTRGKAVFRQLEDHLGNSATWRHRIQRAGYNVLTNVQLAGAHASHWKSNVAERVGDLLQRMGAEKDRIVAALDKPMIDRLSQMERKYHGETWDRFAGMAYDSTVAQVDPRKPPKALDPNKDVPMAQWQKRGEHQRLHEEWKSLPGDLKGAFDDAVRFHKTRQDEMNLGHLKEIVKHVNGGVPNDALAQRVFDGKLTDAEKEVLSGDAAMKAILESKKLSKLQGVYFSLMRHGDYVVSAKHKFDTPMDGNIPAERFTSEGNPGADGNILQFKSRGAAEKFAGETPLHINKIERVFTDASGNRYVENADGTKTKLVKEDFGGGTAEERWRITVQDKHLEFHEDELSAQRAQQALTAQGLEAAGVEMRRWMPDGTGAKMAHDGFETVANSLRQRQSFRELPEESRKVLLQQLHDAAIMALGSTRAQSRALPRTNVQGYSKDLVRNTATYSSQTAGYLARVRYQSRINDALKAMQEEQHARRYEGGDGPLIRSQHMNALNQRIYSASQPERHGFWYGVGSRLLQISYLDKLASPAFHIINSMEPWTVGLPVISGRHGLTRTVAAMHRAYADIGWAGTIAAGARDTVKAFKDPYNLTSYLQRFSDRVSGDERRLLLDLTETGLLSRDAGLELAHHSSPDKGALGRGLDKADLMARQMGTAIEAINRTVVGLSAYRLERARGGDHVAAVTYARRMVHDSMGDYSGHNAAPIFNHPVGRMALQFKKYAQKTYYLLGKQAYAALRGDKEAMKTFGGIMVTHALLAGVLGLPLEAVKAGMMAANMTGATDNDYGDVEAWVRKVAARNLGPAAGEAVSRGVPRYLGVDLSSRVGLDSMLLGMPPKGAKADDIYAYAAKTLAGAPAGLVVEWAEGAQAFAKGDYLTAGQKWAPIKMFADTLTAAQRYQEGRKSKSGRESMTPYSVGEAVTKSLGFTPGREAETMEMRGAIGGEQRKLGEQRRELTQRWVTATPGDRSVMWSRIQRWNEGQPKEIQIKLSELTDALKRREKEVGKPDRAGGLMTTKRDRHLREAMPYYNTGQ